jgi:hypothetical protein
MKERYYKEANERREVLECRKWMDGWMDGWMDDDLDDDLHN